MLQQKNGMILLQIGIGDWDETIELDNVILLLQFDYCDCNWRK